MASDPKLLGRVLQRLNFRSNARNPERMSHGNVQSTLHPGYVESVKNKNVKPDPLSESKRKSIRGIF